MGGHARLPRPLRVQSHRYAITLGALRRARRRASALIAETRESGRPLDLAALEADLLADADDDTTLIIGHWNYAGAGWDNDAEQALALSAAARAREYAQQAAEQRTHINRTRGRNHGGIADRGPTLVGSGRLGISRHTRAHAVRMAECRHRASRANRWAQAPLPASRCPRLGRRAPTEIAG